MATARKNASKAEQLRVSQIGDFKARMGGIMELPSGLVVKAKNPGGLQAFIANGTIPNSLLVVVQKALNSGTKSSTAEVKEIAKDIDSLSEMMALLDVVATSTIIEPKVHKVPTQDDVDRHNILFEDNQVSTPDELRKDELLYTDEIEMMDKQFLFQWISGGTRDLETFREQYKSNVASVSAGDESEPVAESVLGTDTGEL